MTTAAQDRYRLVEKLGQGGTGEVWRAVDERLDRPVAIKLLHAHIASDEATRVRFRREATVMARLQHPNIIRVLDFDGDAARPYLVQEYCSGGTLAALASSGPHHWDRVRAIALPIADALAHAHGMGVIHRDLKPSNVLFASDGRLVVADFGLARILAGDDETITTTGDRMGSPEYWSPEQASGAGVSERADMYALGCILYQLATGRLPFRGDDRLAAGYRRVHEDPAPPSSVNPSLPPEANRFIGALMARRPADRPLAADVAGELRGAGDDRTVRATEARTERLRAVDPTIAVPPPPRSSPPPPPPPPRSPVQPRPAPIYPGVRLGTAVVALFLVGAGAGIMRTADTASTRLTITRAGIETRGRLTPNDAGWALAALGASAVVTIALLVLSIWAARSSGRSRWASLRVVLGVVAVALAALSAGALVWFAHAAAAAGIVDLWNLAV